MTLQATLDQRLSWILWPWVLAAATLGAVFAWFVVFGLSVLIGDRFAPFLAPLSIGAAVYAFIRSGVICAPRFKRAVALMLTTFPLALLALFFFPGHAAPETASQTHNVLDTLSDAEPLNIPDRFLTLYQLSALALLVLGAFAAVLRSWAEGGQRIADAGWSTRMSRVRWAAFIPASIVIAAFVYFVQSGPKIDEDYALFLNTTVAAVFVLAAMAIAPTHKRMVGIICVSSVAVATFVVVTARHHLGQALDWNLTAVPLGGVLGYLAAMNVGAAPSVPAIGVEASDSPLPNRVVSKKRARLVWSALATGVMLGLALLIAAALSFRWTQPSVFSPAAGWHRWPQIPFVTNARQIGSWTSGDGTVWVFAWGEDGTAKDDPVQTPRNVNQFKNSAYTQFRLDSSRRIEICGAHPALIQSFRAIWNGQRDAIVEVYATWGTVGYWAQYVRPASAPADPAAIDSLKTLCGGVPQTTKHPNASTRYKPD